MSGTRAIGGGWSRFGILWWAGFALALALGSGLAVGVTAGEYPMVGINMERELLGL